MNSNNVLVTKIRTITKDYIEGLEKHKDGFDHIQSNFKGEELKTRLAAHEATKPDRYTALNELEACKNSLLYQLDLLAEKALDGGNISPDYALLQLPVTLTVAELQMLNKRNAENLIFTRALLEYCGKHNIDTFAAGLDDPITRRRQAIDDFHKAHDQIIRQDDKDGIKYLEIGGAYERIGEIIS